MIRKCVTLWHKIDVVIQRLERMLLVVGICLVLFGGVLDITLRLFWGRGFSFIDVVSRQLTLLLGLFGATLATRMDEHIRIDALSRLFRPKARLWVRLGISVCCVCLSVLFFVYACHFLNFYMENPTNTIDFGQTSIAAWKILLAFPLAFALMTSRYMLHVFEYSYVLRGEPFEWSTLTSTETL